MVLRDLADSLIIASVRRLNSLWPSSVCEAMAAMFGLELAIRFKLVIYM